MDLTYTKEYLDFEKNVEEFCLNYKDINIVNNSAEGSKKSISRAEWQNLLIENGYFARAIPKEYGGFGGEPDILKSRDRKSTRLNSSHSQQSRMPSSA